MPETLSMDPCCSCQIPVSWRNSYSNLFAIVQYMVGVADKHHSILIWLWLWYHIRPDQTRPYIPTLTVAQFPSCFLQAFFGGGGFHSPPRALSSTKRHIQICSIYYWYYYRMFDELPWTLSGTSSVENTQVNSYTFSVKQKRSELSHNKLECTPLTPRLIIRRLTSRIQKVRSTNRD
eukprot:scaffold5400_cov169-Amphora_coffeaeformis.AAC.2